LKGKHLLPLLASIILILIMLATSCTPTQTTSKPAATTTSKSSSGDTIYKVLSPLGTYQKVQLLGMTAPRLDSLAGKTIVVNQGEGSPIVMPALYERLKKEFPTSKFIYIDARVFLQRMTPEQEKEAKAMIMGNTW
jgi:hypothetical protein